VGETISVSSTRRRRLFVAGSVCWVISGLDLREPLHADSVDFRDPVLERGAYAGKLTPDGKKIRSGDAMWSNWTRVRGNSCVAAPR